MEHTYRPEGDSSVSAYIMADGAQRVIDFRTAVFDARPLRRFDHPNGGINHAEVEVDDMVVMIADGDGAFPSCPVWLHGYVPDVDATYRRALDAGWHFYSRTETKRRRFRPPLRSHGPGRQYVVDRPQVGHAAPVHAAP